MYKIICDGTVKSEETVAAVLPRMAALFKTDVAVMTRIFNEAPTVIQRNLTWEKALKYQEAVEKTGAVCRIESETPAPAAEMPPPIPEPMPPPVPPVPTPLPVPPMYTASPHREPIEEDGPKIAHVDREGWKSMGIGMGITAVVLYFPFLAFVFHYLITLVHEIGHAVVGWLYGYPSIPAFDFSYGGGVTLHQEKNLLIVVIVYLLLAGLVFIFRSNILSVVILLCVIALYSLAVFTDGHQVVMLFAGHGFELLFAAIFLYRALSGSAIVIPAERPLYAFLAFFIFFMDFRFALRLMTSAMHRMDYEDQKGGGHWMDFSRIAEEFWHVELSTVAALFLAFCILTPILTYLFFKHKQRVLYFLSNLLPE